MPRILVHICCAPCATYVVERLREEMSPVELFGYWYNPNIHPYMEYRRRLDALKDYSQKAGLRMIWRDEYDLDRFLRAVVFREDRRCMICYHMRLLATAQVARRGKFDYFTTTLLYSKTQNHELVKEVAQAVAHEKGVKFLYRDFREGWKRGIELSLQEGLYRQNYCGCIYSERDRFSRRRTGWKSGES